MKERHLRISYGAKTEYRWYKEFCSRKILGICVKHEKQEMIENDFDFNKKEDVDKFNDMGFDCSVRKRPI